ncbi:MAG: polyphosphate:AMP phosphotransferase [Byssovorax sp.]
MFESAELGHTIDKERYATEEPALREALLDAQYELLESKKFPVIIIISGVDGAGKGETVNVLNEWMDARHIQTHALAAPSADDTERPAFYRFWRHLPPKGASGIFFTSWYTAPILSRAYRSISKADLDQRMDEARRFERMLASEGALILKFWFHLSKDQQRARLTKLEKNPKTRWRVTERDWTHFEIYDRFRKVSERALRETSIAEAPWIVVEGADARYRNLTVGKAILSAIRARLDASAPPAVDAALLPPPPIDELNVLKKLDLTLKVAKEDYKPGIAKLQRKLALLTLDPRFKEISVVAAFEGADAAGKGGAIRRITSALDARLYHLHPIAAPTEEERAQPYLWRFWRHLPRLGKLSIFDRTWYGRVLVERVEGFCSEADWMRAYSEINDFEQQMTDSHSVVVKFWLHIDQDTQLARFKEREATAFKRFKITPDDWRNREKWPAYERAICDMVDRTSTEIAPWTLVESNDKYFARTKILKTLIDRIEAALEKKK